LGFEVSGFHGAKVSGFQGAKVSGFQGAKVSGFRGAKVSGFHGAKAKQTAVNCEKKLRSTAVQDPKPHTLSGKIVKS